MKLAGVQMDVGLAEVDANVRKIMDRLEYTRRQGAELVVFPECAVTGYCFDCLDEARPHAQSIPGPITDRIGQVCADLQVFTIFGMLEASGEHIYNAAVLIGPAGVIGTYRKVHLPFLGVDKLLDCPDRPFVVHEAGEVRVGMNICYDAAFPEASRSLAILGADLIALPTNWPPGAEGVAEHVINARALENNVYFIAVNRVGMECGFQFIGRSRICAPDGKTLAASDGATEEILFAQIDPQLARNKRVVREPSRHAIDRMADRRPDMYELLTRPHALKGPRGD